MTNNKTTALEQVQNDHLKREASAWGLTLPFSCKMLLGNIKEYYNFKTSSCALFNRYSCALFTRYLQEQVRILTNEWIWRYNNIRPHDSLLDLTPRQFLLKYGKVKDFPTFQQDINMYNEYQKFILLSVAT